MNIRQRRKFINENKFGKRRFNESRRGINLDGSTIIVCYSDWQDKSRNKKYQGDLTELVFELADSRPNITETNSVLEIEFEGLIDASDSQISQLIKLAKKASTYGYIESDEITMSIDW